jgi:hypothetical protein
MEGSSWQKILVSSPVREPVFQQAAQEVSHLIPAPCWMKPAAKTKLSIAASAFIIVVKNLST